MMLESKFRNHQSTSLAEISGNNQMNKIKFCSLVNGSDGVKIVYLVDFTFSLVKIWLGLK